MFRKSLVGSQLPVYSNQYYITVKFLKKLANGDKVKLHQLICPSGTISALAEKDENHIKKLCLGSTNPHPNKARYTAGQSRTVWQEQ